MRRFLSTIILVFFVWLTLFALGAKAGPDAGIEAELKALKSRVVFLEQRVKNLESRFRPGRMTTDHSAAIAPTFPQMPQAPKSWRKKEFNGIDYYVVPLQAAANDAARKTR